MYVNMDSQDLNLIEMRECNVNKLDQRVHFWKCVVLCGGQQRPHPASLVTLVKNPPANAGDSGSIPGRGRSPGEGNDNPLSPLAWEISGTEQPGGL